MNRKPLGSTRDSLPEVGQGTYQFNSSPDVLRAGVELGANFIDTAESYGTESLVGEAIRGMRHQVFVATKAVPANFRRRDLIAAADASLRRLGTDYIDLYQLHWPNYNVPIGETMAAMEDLVDAGKIRFIGVSSFSSAELARAQKALSKYHIVSNQLPYSLVERGIEAELLPFCQRNQITIIAFKPLARGIDNLTRNDKQGALSRVAAEIGKTETQVALNWCISKAAVVAVVKAGSRSHVAEDCAASGWYLTPNLLATLDRGLRHRRLGYFGFAVRRLRRRILQHLGSNLGSANRQPTQENILEGS